MRRPRLGVRSRVVLAFALATALLLGGAGLAVREGLRDRLTDAVDESLQTQAAATARLLDLRGPEPGLTAGLDDPGERFTQVIDPRGRVVVVTPGLPRAPLLDRAALADAAEGLTARLRGVALDGGAHREEIEREALEDTGAEAFEEDRARLLARGATVDGRRYTIVVGTTFEDTDDALAALDRILLVAGPLVLLGACLVGFGAVAGALRPVERMRRRAATIGADASGERLPVPAARDEIGRLGTTLNGMLDRLQDALERERTFVADAGHELRTPLAVQRTGLELALRGERTPEELRAALASAREETLRLTRMTDDLLLLARGDDAGVPLRREELTASALLERVRARMAGRAKAEGRVLAAAASEVVLHADAERLEQALVALADNALLHGAGPVDLFARRTGAVVELVVADRGPGIDAAFLPEAFERFSRPDASRSAPGSGLGLAIVRALAEAHGGTAELRERPGGGTEAIVIVPSSAPA